MELFAIGLGLGLAAGVFIGVKMFRWHLADAIAQGVLTDSKNRRWRIDPIGRRRKEDR